MRDDLSMPDIQDRDSFDTLVRKLLPHFVRAVSEPHTFEELRTTLYAKALQPLVRHLSDHIQHPAVVSALLALKGHFTVAEADDERGINASRALACELVAWRFVTHLTDRDAIDHLCYELPQLVLDGERERGRRDLLAEAEEAPLLQSPNDRPEPYFLDGDASGTTDDEVYAVTYRGLTALEIAAVCDAKKFLSQKQVQRVIDGIWKGDVIFWESMSTHSTKQAKVYNPKRSDPFSRLRVPLYLKAFEVLFFAGFLAFYYVVLVQKSFHSITTAEIMLYIWLTSFAYNELVELWDAGFTFYATDFWSLWDIGIILTGIAFFIARMIGLVNQDPYATDVAFDILSVEALFLVPRLCSLLSLHPYFGTLLPCLKEMTKDFIKFLGLVAILYLGFNTTFAFLARGTYSFRQMNWILVKVFFGSSYLGFISPVLGPPLMFIFVCLTNILLITSLISLLSNSLTKIMDHAREEYLFVYAVYVLEAATSNRLTYFLPPLNLAPLLLRPLRLCLSAEGLRRVRIVLLKVTHVPFVALILAYEGGRQILADHQRAKSSSARSFGRDASVNSINSSLLLRRAVSSKTIRPVLAKPTSKQRPLDDQARNGRPSARKNPPTSVAGLETTEALQRLVGEMTSQLRAVEALLEREKARS